MSLIGVSTGYGPMSTRMHRLYFDGSEHNYEAWEEKFLGYLLLKDIEKTVTAPESETVDADSNKKAYAELIQFLDPTSHQLVMRDAKFDGRKAMQILKGHYSGKGKSRILSLYTEIMTLSKLPSETTTEFILKAEKMVTALKNAGEQFSDSLLIAIILKGLPEEFTPFSVVVQQKDDTMDFVTFKTKLRSYEENIRSRQMDGGRNSNVMYTNHFRGAGGARGRARGKKFGGGNRGGATNGGPSASGISNKACYSCGTTGHGSKDCIQKKNGLLWCSVCQTNSHNNIACRNKNKLKVNQVGLGPNQQQHQLQSQFTEHTFMFMVEESKTDANDNNSDNSAFSFDDEEDYDEETVEENEQCTFLFMLAEQIVNNDNNNEDLIETIHVDNSFSFEDENKLENEASDVVEREASIVENQYDVKTESAGVNELSLVEEKEEVFMVTETETDVEVSELSAVNSLLLVDSGCSAHIKNDDSEMTNIRQDFKPHSHTVELADGTKQSGVALKRGDVPINLRDDQGRVMPSVLRDTLYIPSFPQDIFSVNKAVEAGAEVTFGKNSKMVCGNTSFQIHHQRGLFYLDTVNTVKVNSVRDNLKTPNNSKPLNSGPQKSACLETWHRIMGHCNKSDVLKQEKVVNGMKITSKNNFNCESCTLGKQVQHFNRKPDERAERQMEFVHTDLCGPITPVAREGFRYALAFVDDYSGATFVYFLKQKSDAAKGLLKYLADSAPYGKITLQDDWW